MCPEKVVKWNSETKQFENPPWANPEKVLTKEEIIQSAIDGYPHATKGDWYVFDGMIRSKDKIGVTSITASGSRIASKISDVRILGAAKYLLEEVIELRKKLNEIESKNDSE